MEKNLILKERLKLHTMTTSQFSKSHPANEHFH